jgi:hypothetical protein
MCSNKAPLILGIPLQLFAAAEVSNIYITHSTEKVLGLSKARKCAHQEVSSNSEINWPDTALICKYFCPETIRKNTKRKKCMVSTG